MLSKKIRTLAAALPALAMLAACSDGDDVEPAAQTTEDAGADSAEQADEQTDEDETAAHEHDDSGMSELDVTPELADQVAAMRAATATYANDLDAALDDGFFIITQHIEDMGYHFLNPAVEEFDLADPPILVYARDGDDWQLVALEWVFPEEPEEPPMDGATYGDFPAACHYDDGLFVVEPEEDACDETHTETGAAFTFWHPDLVTFHVWAWKHNPDGIYNGTNPLMTPYNSPPNGGEASDGTRSNIPV